jgi:hypothetical protein
MVSHGHDDIPIVPWSSKMYSSETKSMGFQIQSMEQEKQTMELMATKECSPKNLPCSVTKTHNIRVTSKTSFPLMKTTCKPTCLLQTKHRRFICAVGCVGNVADEKNRSV